jgi:hypothetical protein
LKTQECEHVNKGASRLAYLLQEDGKSRGAAPLAGELLPNV